VSHCLTGHEDNYLIVWSTVRAKASSFIPQQPELVCSVDAGCLSMESDRLLSSAWTKHSNMKKEAELFRDYHIHKVHFAPERVVLVPT